MAAKVEVVAGTSRVVGTMAKSECWGYWGADAGGVAGVADVVGITANREGWSCCSASYVGVE